MNKNAPAFQMQELTLIIYNIYGEIINNSERKNLIYYIHTICLQRIAFDTKHY